MRCIRELEEHLRSLNQCYSQAPIFPIACDIDYSMASLSFWLRYRFENPEHNIAVEVSRHSYDEIIKSIRELNPFNSVLHDGMNIAVPIYVAVGSFWPILSEAPSHERVAVMPELPSFSICEESEPVQELQVRTIEVHRGWLGIRRDYRTENSLHLFFYNHFVLNNHRLSYLNDALAGRLTTGYGTPVNQAFYGTLENDIEPITEEAKEKAWKLFKSHLTPQQSRDFEKNKFIICTGSSTGDIYKIKCNNNRNFNITTNNNVLCFQPEGDLPLGDFYLAQKLAIECNEDEVLRVCNRLMPSVNEALWFNRNMLGSIEVDRARSYGPLSEPQGYILMWLCTANIIICVMSILKIWGIM